MRFSPTCRCCACNWTITVRGGCDNAVVRGMPVAAKQSGVTIGSGTTNVSGVVVLDVPAGTYDLVVAPPSGYGYATSTTTVVHTCSQSTTITLGLASGHNCMSCCGPTATTFSVTFSNPSEFMPNSSVTYSSGVTYIGPWENTTDPLTTVRLEMELSGCLCSLYRRVNQHGFFFFNPLGNGSLTGCNPAVGGGAITNPGESGTFTVA